MRKPAVVLILLVLALLPSEGFSGEAIVARIACPAETKAKVSWDDEIHDDPTYSRESPPDEWLTFTFKKMEQVEQKITCQYEFKGGTRIWTKNYEYTAKRKIISCKKVGSAVIDCFLK